MHTATLTDCGILRVAGDDARAFLHAQLTVDVEQLPQDRARHAGWCSAKGRLLATFLVIPVQDGYLLRLARDLVAPVAKRLSMFVLRAKVRITDDSAAWPQHGVWGDEAGARLNSLGIAAPGTDLAITHAGARLAVRIGPGRFLVLGAADLQPNADEQGWSLQDIQSGVATITLATQDQLVPQMANLELVGGVDFRKGCYPGQEIVARAQYRGAVKRRLYRMRSATPLAAGQVLYSDDLPGQSSGTVVNAAGGEALAVLQIASVEAQAAVRAAPGGEPIEILPLPYAL